MESRAYTLTKTSLPNQFKRKYLLCEEVGSTRHILESQKNNHNCIALFSDLTQIYKGPACIANGCAYPRYEVIESIVKLLTESHKIIKIILMRTLNF